jgi:glycosyltransferase involved in cell wall biosynthesis
MAPGALPIIAARLAGIQTILATVHQPYTKEHGRFAKFLLRLSARLCTKFMVVSQNAEQSWFGTSQLYDTSIPLKEQAKHFTIYNAVDVNKIKGVCKATNMASLRMELGIPENSLVVGAVSRLRHEKGIDILIEAFNQVSKNAAQAHLVLVGDGPDAPKLRALVRTFKLEHRVHFIGVANWERAMQYMALMSIIVVPSRFEGFGLTAAEAMAMGKPVVASTVYGLKEVVHSEVTGLLFKPEDVSELAQHVSLLLKDSALRQRMGNAGQSRAHLIFDVSVYQNNIVTLYKAVTHAL